MNLKKVILSMVTATCLFSINANALTLKETLNEVLETNPVVQERLKNLNETREDLNIAKSEWLPSLDYRGTIGRNNSGDLKDGDVSKGSSFNHNVRDSSYSHYTNSLKLTQNIFNGFSTTEKINYQEARVFGAAYHYLENANDIAFNMTQAYIDLLRSYQLLQNAKDNVVINKKIYEDVQSLYDQGLTTKSEMTKIYASLSLANSNLVVQQNNTMDKEFKFKRLYGRSVNVGTLEVPKLDLAMPESKQRATMIAIQNNPSMIVSSYNIKGAQALYREKKSKFMPSVDIEAEQMFNDYTKDNGFDSADDRQRIYAVLNWNLFKGGAHSADLQKSRSTINKELELQRDLKRQTIEGLELSWSAYEMLGKQLTELYKYYEYSEETLSSYQSEYEMGRRTLLDLLSAQNDLISSKAQIINAQMDKLFAQYRILDAMGMLVSSVLDDKDYAKIIKTTTNPLDLPKDEIPVLLDVDNDKVVDHLDICDNSVVGNNDVGADGCNKEEKDSDFDGIPDSKDKCPDTPFGAVVGVDGCPVGVENKFNMTSGEYINSVLAYDENSPKKESKKGLYDYEFNVAANKNIESTTLDKHLMYDDFAMIKRFDFVNMNNKDESKIDEMAKNLKEYNGTNAVVTLIGNTRATKNKEASFDKGLDYANSLKAELVKKGVDEKIIVTQSRADLDKTYTQTVRSDASLNDVVVAALYVPKSSITNNDSDGDGVINELDECPNTPSGQMVNEKGCANSINLQVLFENDSDKVIGSSLEKVKAFANYLLENKDFEANITGHASQSAKESNKNSYKNSAKYNLELSLKRAEAIKNILVQNGVPSSRITSTGKGFEEPIMSNDTEEGRATNRRIEAVLIKK
ncbi:TolC family outer membrane protein [Aliarcobacter cryaerophilus]|uniref:TolC family outer membrane protein n=1 Tax=Aliarcobacter cryaerophilus TaxID=28198 RepID=UPI0021B1A798|nr:TolC family outer membrane protein [Aliarcobacter cryaerophilus]MCT7482789.1 TolC family outer membrane protein [Aliarcobacter cryaerophilus]